MPCGFRPSALEMNSNGKFKQACEILLFNHKKYYIFTNIMSMTAKPSRMVTYYKALQLIKSHDLSFM